jgi:hypothetical protein
MSNRSVLAFQNLTISTDAGTEDIYCKAEHSLPEHDCSVPVRWWRSVRHGSIPVPTAPEIRSEPGSQPAKRRMLSGSLPPAIAILPIPSNCCAANSPPVGSVLPWRPRWRGTCSEKVPPQPLRHRVRTIFGASNSSSDPLGHLLIISYILPSPNSLPHARCCETKS